ncbi:MAG: flagellar hook-basal body complex protein FliE [Candidatus Eremiobacteraeota bacterium]|nr:flagellar hook-basal body complex protein FliE [Candidatus Eremiobacteraeota bacterium]
MDIPSFDSVMSKVSPGTFVPDMGSAPKTTELPGDAAAIGATTPATASFGDTLKGLLHDVSEKVNTSDANSRDLAMGKTNDIGKVVTSVEEANLAMQFTMAVRNKLMESYSEISRMSV